MKKNLKHNIKNNNIFHLIQFPVLDKERFQNSQLDKKIHVFVEYKIINQFVSRLREFHKGHLTVILIINKMTNNPYGIINKSDFRRANNRVEK